MALAIVRAAHEITEAFTTCHEGLTDTCSELEDSKMQALRPNRHRSPLISPFILRLTFIRTAD